MIRISIREYVCANKAVDAIRPMFTHDAILRTLWFNKKNYHLKNVKI